MILPCTCKHQFQEETHGEGMRVHNPLKKTKDGPAKYRCTVCKTVR